MAGPMRERERRATDWEYRTVTVARSVSRSDYRKQLADEAEVGHWEVRRVLVFRDGTRKVTLRRRSVRVALTL